MKRILVTGATGNVGKEVIKYLLQQPQKNTVIAGCRNMAKDAVALKDYLPTIQMVHFNFEDANTFASAFEAVDTLFLLRPPHIADVKKYFNPLIAAVKASAIKELVFLSVQGVEKSSLIPHHKIEHAIMAAKIPYIFIRPSYFMQNITTTFLSEIQLHSSISVPAGNAVFNWVDVANIGEVAAYLLNNFSENKHRAFDVTGNENISFKQMAVILSQVLQQPVRFISPNLFSFFLKKRKEGIATPFVIAMLLLHFLPRFQKWPDMADTYERFTGKKPTSLATFFLQHKQLLLSGK